MTRVHCLQHSDRVPPDGVSDWAASRGVELVTSRVDRGELPELGAVERLVVLGGEMNTDEADRHPWLRDERAWLRDLLEQRGDVRVLGICLGSQLLAEVLGGQVQRAGTGGREIGWHRVELTPDGRRHPALRALPPAFDAFEWHGDAWTLPPGADLAITGPGCPTQGFVRGERVVAVQFHPEFTLERTRERARTTDDDLTAGGLVQPPEHFLADPARFEELARVRDLLLDGVLDVAPPG